MGELLYPMWIYLKNWLILILIINIIKINDVWFTLYWIYGLTVLILLICSYRQITKNKNYKTNIVVLLSTIFFSDKIEV